MQLTFNLEYFGNCRDALDFYSSVFELASIRVRTFREMDMAQSLGITKTGLDLIWQADLSIPSTGNILSFEMADSMMAAMQMDSGFNSLYFQPTICVSGGNENLVHRLFQKLYNGQDRFEHLCRGNVADAFGIRWQYEAGGRDGLYYCLTFDGFCRDVAAFYENVFGIRAMEFVRYGDSPLQNEVPGAGADKIYSAMLPFEHDGRAYILKLRDSFESARTGQNNYDPDALLFYQGQYNPVFTVRDHDPARLTQAFGRLCVGAKLNRPLAAGTDGKVYGSLIDKYGICWNFYTDKEI